MPEVAEKVATAGIPVTTTLVVGYDIVTAYGNRRQAATGAAGVPGQVEDDARRQPGPVPQVPRAGVNFIAGTDAGWRRTRFDDLAYELYLMTEGGMSALEAIRHGTAYTAEVLGIGDKVGTVKPGFTADIIAVAGDPAGRPAQAARRASGPAGRRVTRGSGQGVREEYPAFAESM